MRPKLDKALAVVAALLILALLAFFVYEVWQITHQ
jgi:TRAP-type C4-dicarboxylate transport system permease small subunit